jgi:hypothetical protein
MTAPKNNLRRNAGLHSPRRGSLTARLVSARSGYGFRQSRPDSTRRWCKYELHCRYLKEGSLCNSHRDYSCLNLTIRLWKIRTLCCLGQTHTLVGLRFSQRWLWRWRQYVPPKRLWSFIGLTLLHPRRSSTLQAHALDRLMPLNHFIKLYYLC